MTGTQTARWLWSPLDHVAHLLSDDGEQLPGVPKTRCGRLLTTPAPQEPTNPRTCAVCADLLRADHLRRGVRTVIALLARDTVPATGLVEVMALAEQAPDLTDEQLTAAHRK